MIFMLCTKIENLRVLIFTSIVVGMHIIGSCVLAAFLGGPKLILGGFVLAVFGFYFLPFELIGVFLIWEYYKPEPGQDARKTIKIGLIIGIIGAIVISPFIPKEEGSEILGWVASSFASFIAVVFAFISIHKAKLWY